MAFEIVKIGEYICDPSVIHGVLCIIYIYDKNVCKGVIKVVTL